MDPGIAGSVGAALWCLARFQLLERERPPSRRGRAAGVRALALAWSAGGAVGAGTAACLLVALLFASPLRPGLVAAGAYLGLCATVLAGLLFVEGLVALYRVRARRETAQRRRRTSVRTLMRAGPASRVPL